MGTQQVVLLDADEVGASARPRRRRIRSWWALVPLLVITALLTVQSVVDRREHAALERLPGLPGVVAAVPPIVGVRWSPGAGADALFTSGIQADGAVVGLVHGADGSQELVSFDERTGARRWSTPVLAADADAVPTPSGVPFGGCERQGENAICLVTDGYVEHGINPPLVVDRDRSSITVVDLHDGHTLTSRAAPGVSSFAALPGLVVTARESADGGLTVEATDTLTGDRRWTHEQSAPPVAARGWIVATAGGIAVWMPPGSVTLLGPDGSVRRADADARSGYGVQAGEMSLTTTDAAGDPVSSDLRTGVRYAGDHIAVEVDDGSVPGLVLTSGNGVRAVDATTGRPRWTLDRQAFGDALVLLGRVYLTTSDGLVAVDGSSGAEVWRAPAPEGAILRTQFTDGRHVLVSQRRDSTTELAAYALDDGAQAWRTALPEQIDTVYAVGHLLIGWNRGTPSVVG